MKKLLGLLTLTVIVAPVATTISCGTSQKIEKKIAFEVTNDSKDVNYIVADVIKNYFNNYVDEGAEALALKSIHIFDSSNAPYQDEGDYIPESNEIIINTQKMHEYSNFTDDDKVNYIMQLLAHEYNHYVDHTYLMGISSKSDKADLSIHDWNNYGAVVPWPSAFLDRFKTDLHYDDNSALYEDTEVSPGFKSLGSVYNQKDLFDMANGDKNPSSLYIKLKGNEVMAPINPIVEVSSHRTIKADSLSYLYSMDELFARKMQIITSKYYRSENFDDKGYMHLPNKVSESPYLQDIVNYQRGLNDFNNKGQYLLDKPTKDLASLYEEVRGTTDNIISFAEVKNDKHIQSDGTFKGEVDRTKIRFGGNTEEKYKFIGWTYGDNNEHYKCSPIAATDGHFITDFLDADELLGKQLYLSEDFSGEGKVKITNTRDTKFGNVTTHRYMDPDGAANYEFSNVGILQTL